MHLFIPVFIFSVIIFAVVAVLTVLVERAAERRERGQL
jgi:hypothetical protein